MANSLEVLAGSLPSWGAKLAYGEKSTLDGRDILPVAAVVFGFGAGEGSGEMPDDDVLPARRGEGSGGGGGGYTIPLGAYVAGQDGLVFRSNPVALVAVIAVLASVIGGAAVRLWRASGH